MNIKIYFLGDRISKFYKEAIKEYEKRLGRYCKIQLIGIKDQHALTKTLSPNSYKIWITTKGENISSEELAAKINMIAISGNSDMAIIIGGEAIQFDEHLAISSMEMESGLQVTILFEQIYRAYRILNNQPYHK